MIVLAARPSLAEAKEVVKQAANEVRADTKIIAINLDVTSIDSVQAAAKEVKSAFGHLDVLINNSGYLSTFQLIGSSDPLEYWKTWETNLNGTYLCVRYFLPLLLDLHLKTTINISSGDTHVVIPGASAYQSSKFALCRFTEFLDAEYAEQGLITLALHPGGVKTELAHTMPESMHDLLTDTVELAAETLVWLCKERRKWLGGRFVASTWNMEELERRKEEIVRDDLLKFRMAF
jgi:NAD(P)-dependent dehydrogenase (short-subunit alcohol dehydrogenase family)